MVGNGKGIESVSEAPIPQADSAEYLFPLPLLPKEFEGGAGQILCVSTRSLVPVGFIFARCIVKA